MLKTNKSQKEILKIVLKDLATKYTITSLSKKLAITRMGVWKALKSLESDKFVSLIPAGEGKTSTYKVRLNWENPLVEKNLVTLLLEEAMKNQRWVNNFAELENKIDFLILYGSILNSPKDAKDIDILSVVKNKKHFVEIDKLIAKVQLTQIKKIHAIGFTKEEFKKELIVQNNKAFIEAIEKGVILFGQENFIKFIRELNKFYIG